MFTLQLSLLILIGIIGMIFNWLLILAIQRKTYHYQYANRIPSQTTNISLLRPNSLLNEQIVQPPFLPSVRSSISIFDKFILAFLINDIFVCNFLLPLRFLDISQGLPCGFLCFMFKLFEKLSTTLELIITNLLLITSLIYFWKKRLLTTKLWFILIIIMTPIVISCFITTLTYLDVDEDEQNHRPPTCKQTFIYINITTEKTLNTFCCLITYVLIFVNFILLIKTKRAIQVYKKNALRTLTEAVVSTRNDLPSNDQVIRTGFSFSRFLSNSFQYGNDSNRRRSMYYSPSITMESSITATIALNHRSTQPIDHMSYLTVMENSQTLVRSTWLILLVYLLVHIPYWLYEFWNNQMFAQLKDMFFLCHIFKPFCYMLTNEKYRDHVRAILQRQTFRMLPNLLRRKSRVLTLDNNNTLNISA